MKKAVEFSILVFFMSTSMVFASGFSPMEDFPKAIKEIKIYLNEALEEEALEEKNAVKIVFTVNSDNEIIVLDVRTKNKKLKGYVKSTLNNKTLSTGDLIPGKQYSFKVVIK